MTPTKPAIIQVVGFKKTGKTTLVCALVERFAAAGLRVGTIKHDGHDFDPDVHGTDSWRHRHSGASYSAVASDRRTAFFEERGAELDELVLRMKEADAVLVEGWKEEHYPKLVLAHSVEQWKTLSSLSNVLAAVSWDDALQKQLAHASSLPVFSFGEPDAIAGWLRERLHI